MMWAMIDRSLRRMKDRTLDAFAAGVIVRFRATWMTAIGLALAVGVAVIAATQLTPGGSWVWRPVAVAGWAASRLFDGLDGSIARARDEQTDRGGYFDLMADSVSYALVPCGLAVAQDTTTVWMLCALLLGSYYVNTMSWTYLSTIVERRGLAMTAADSARSTSIEMPAGLIEGAETMVLYVAMLAWPSLTTIWFAATAALVVLTAALRFGWAMRWI